MTRETILQEALRLSADDRKQIANELYQSLDEYHDELTPAQREDLDSRLKAHRAGDERVIPWEVVREELMKKP